MYEVVIKGKLNWRSETKFTDTVTFRQKLLKFLRGYRQSIFQKPPGFYKGSPKMLHRSCKIEINSINEINSIFLGIPFHCYFKWYQQANYWSEICVAYHDILWTHQWYIYFISSRVTYLNLFQFVFDNSLFLHSTLNCIVWNFEIEFLIWSKFEIP